MKKIYVQHLRSEEAVLKSDTKIAFSERNKQKYKFLINLRKIEYILMHKKKKQK